MSNKLKAIKFKCYQNMPNYRRPASFDFKETFKLPPYSSVIGMIHKVCNCKNGEYMPMKISIQGISESINTDLYTRYFFTPDKCEGDREYFAILNKNEKRQTGLIRGTGISELLIDVNLLIHIVPENEKLFDYSDSKFGILGYDSAANLFITLLKQYDIPYTEAGTNVNTGEILWNNQQAKDLTKKFAEYAEKKYIVVPQAVDEEYTSNLFVAQNCLFTVSSTAGISHIAGQGVNIGCAVIPQADLSNKAVISQGPSFCVLDRGNENENLACWLFYKYITSSKNNITWSMGSGYFPIRDSSYNSREFQSYYHLDDLGYFTDKSALDYGQAITYSKSEEIGSYAYTSPVFRNSSASRNAVDGLMVQILTDGRNSGADAVEYDTLFTEAYNNAING